VLDDDPFLDRDEPDEASILPDLNVVVQVPLPFDLNRVPDDDHVLDSDQPEESSIVPDLKLKLHHSRGIVM